MSSCRGPIFRDNDSNTTPYLLQPYSNLTPTHPPWNSLCEYHTKHKKMARLKGPIKFSGALGELVAYQLNGKWIVRRKSSLDKKRVKSDPAFKNAHKASQEFGGAATISKYLGDRWRLHLQKDPRTPPPLRAFTIHLQRQALSPGHPFAWLKILDT